MKKHSALIAIVLSMVAVSCGGSSSSSGDTSSESGAPASKTEFCTAFTEFMAASEKLGESTSSSGSEAESAESIKEVKKIVGTLADTMTRTAPDDLKDDAKLVAESLVKAFDILTSIDDMSQLEGDPELTAELEALNNNPDLTSAQEAVDTYVTNECGIDLDDSSASSDSEGGDFCQTTREFISAKMSLGMLYDPDQPDKESVKFAFQSVVSLAGKMVDSAPEEMQGNAKTIADNESKIMDGLKDVDYDITMLPDDSDSDPAVGEALQAVQDHCGIVLDGGMSLGG